MLIRVIEIGEVKNASKGRNNWQEIAIKYQGNKGEQSRTIRSFEQNVFNAFKSDIKPGDTVDVKVVKEGDYWQWKEAQVVEGGSNNQAEKSTPTKIKTGDWETSAERAAKQSYIVRQSSIANAIAYFAMRGNRDAGVAEVLGVAKEFENFVFDKTPVAAEVKPKRGRPAKQTEEDEVE